MYDASGGVIAQANGGAGGHRRSDSTADGGTASGGSVNITGGYGGGKEDGGAVSPRSPSPSRNPSKPNGLAAVSAAARRTGTTMAAVAELLLLPMVASEDETMLALGLWVLVEVAEGTA